MELGRVAVAVEMGGLPAVAVATVAGREVENSLRLGEPLFDLFSNFEFRNGLGVFYLFIDGLGFSGKFSG